MVVADDLETVIADPHLGRLSIRNLSFLMPSG